MEFESLNQEAENSGGENKNHGPFATADSQAHSDPSTSTSANPPRPEKTISRDANPRHWYLCQKGRFTVEAENLERFDVLDAIVEEVKCSQETAQKLVRADLVRLADDQETPALIGHFVTPGGLTIAYRCEGAIRLEDANEDGSVWLDRQGHALPIQEREAWRAKCLDGCFASRQSNDGYPIFRELRDENGDPSVKYASPRGAPACLLFVPRSINPALYDGPEEVWLVEGEKKAILLAEAGVAAVSICGVSSFGYLPDQQRAAVAGGSPAPTLAPVLAELLKSWGTKTVVIGFDSPDIYGAAHGGNDDVVREAGRLAAALKFAGYEAGWLVLPRPPGSLKWGADDWLVTHRTERITKFVTTTVEDYREALEAADGREVALLGILLARARGLRALGIAPRGSPGSQVQALVKKLKLSNEAAVLELLADLARERPEAWLRSWLESHHATYSYRDQSVVIDGSVKPIDGLLERLHLDSLEGPRFKDKTISAALGQWMEWQDQMRVEALRVKLAFDPAASGAPVESFVKACTGRTDPVDVQVVKHFIWQVKRKLHEMPVDHHLMPILVREPTADSKAQGGGKSTAVARLLSPISETVVNVSDLREAVDPRGFRRFTRAFGAVIDEMARGETANTDALKWLLTNETLSWRVLGTNKDAHGRNRATFIGTANKCLPDLIYDTTGVRRFYQLDCLETLEWKTINELDYLAMWRSVDEQSTAPILSVKAELDARQAAWTPKDALEEWLTGFERHSELDPKTWMQASMLYGLFSDWLRRTGRPSWSQTRCGRRLKALLKKDEWREERRGTFYAVFPAVDVAHP